VVPAEFIGLIPGNTSADHTRTVGFSALAPELVNLQTASCPGRCALSWHEYELPPPPDLVITLAHFLI
jgi:hypothetical protein